MGKEALDPPPSIECPACHRVSYNINDIRERYCGHCHNWHDFLTPQPKQAPLFAPTASAAAFDPK